MHIVVLGFPFFSGITNYLRCLNRLSSWVNQLNQQIGLGIIFILSQKKSNIKDVSPFFILN